jgi:hypothetical protein
VSAPVQGISISFSVDSFKNPYNGKPNSGYYVQTQDSGRGNVDSSQIAGIVMSIQMTDWADFSEASIGRDDSITTVGELSIGNIFFRLDFPVDQSCRVTVKFPSDMPLTSDLTQLTLSGILNGSPTFTKNTGTSILQVNACTSYS